MRIAIGGFGEDGKGTAATTLSRLAGLRYRESTSQAAARLVYDQLRLKYGYQTVEECWDDRRNHRAEWAQIIWDHNRPDGITLYAEMCEDNDIIEGIRNADELQACREAGIIQVAVWIDYSHRRSPESPASARIGADDCDVVIDSPQGLEHLERQLRDLADSLRE